MTEASQPRQTSVEIEGEDRGDRGEREAVVGSNRFILPADGYEWKKYGQKFIRNIGKNKGYFKCKRSDCSVRKKVDWSTSEPEYVRIVYEGVHNHTSPAEESSSSQSQTPSSRANQYDLWTQVFGDRSAFSHDNDN